MNTETLEWEISKEVVESMKGRLAYLGSINCANEGWYATRLADAEAALASGVEWGITDWGQGQARVQPQQ